MYKSLAAPPLEVQARVFDAPVARAHGQDSNAMLYKIERAINPGDNLAFQYQLKVPTELGQTYRLQLLTSNAQWIQASNLVIDSDAHPLTLPGQSQVFEFFAPQAGEADINILQNPPDFQSIHTGTTPKTLVSNVLITTDSPYRLYSHFNHLDFLDTNTIGLNAFIYHNDATSSESMPSPLQSVIHSATLTIENEFSQKSAFVMSDDGQSDDQAAGDGIYGVLLPKLPPGKYQISIEVKGTTPEGENFFRTSHHLMPIVKAPYELTEKAKLGAWYQTPKNHHRLPIQIQIQGARLEETAQLSAELWGKNAHQEWVLVSWLGGIIQPLSSGYLTQSVDIRWLQRAKITNQLELRNIKLIHPEYHILFSHKEKIPLPQLSFPTHYADAMGHLQLNPEEFISIDETMLIEDRPKPDNQIFGHYPGLNSGNNHKSNIIFAHGYCSGRVWEKAHDQYNEETLEFLQLGVNVSNDTFARQLRQFGARLPAFSLIAHSQGGMAALHLYTFYYSGLDKVGPGRLIQTIGTPFQGSPLAGTPAVVGHLFGIGCGANFDLTPEGAALWLSRIPLWARERVYYYTTSVKDHPWRYDACNIGTDWLLKDPDDGVVEKHRAFLPGGHYLGHSQGECHTRLMKDPSQTENNFRNSVMRWSAAR